MATDAAPPYEGNHLPQQTLPPSSPVLPLDLIMEILSWVPVKSLIRFRCVSKTWNSLIFDPTFVKLHLYRSSKNTHILLTFLDKDLDTCVTLCSIRGLFENPSSTVDNGYHIFNHCSFVFGVCNGLVCMLDSLQEDEIGEYRVRFWNPATRVMSEDLSFCLRSNDYKIGQYSWQCGYPKCGFGHDDLSDTYKAVVILLDVKSQQRELRVHSMGDTGWRKILTCPAFPILRTQLYGQFVNDCINWLALRRFGCDYRWKTVTIDQLVIFSYDIKKETHRYLLMPDGLSEVPLSEPCLGVLRGCLCLSHDHRRTHFTVWLMREFGVEKSWTRLLNVSYEHLQIHGFPPCTKFIPLCMSENEEVLLLANFGGSELVFYNQRDNRIDRVEDFEPYKSLFLSHDYIQSLVLPY